MRVVLSAAIVLCVTTAHADTTIRVNFTNRVYRLDPPVGYFMAPPISASLVLTEDGQATSSATLPGRYSQTLLNKSRLGIRGSDPSMTYRVVNQNTIQATRRDNTYTTTITVRVSGQSCTMTAAYRLNPGHKEFVTYSATYGRDVRFRSIELVDSSCTIQ